MSALVSSIILIVMVLGTLVLFAFIPFLKNHFQKYYAGGILVFLIIMFFIPGSWICSIPLPILNDSVNDFCVNIFSEIKLYNDVVVFDSTLQGNLLHLVQGIVKMCFVFITLSLVLFFTSLVLYIIHLCKPNKKIFKTTSGLLVILIMCFVYTYVPIYSALNLHQKANETLSSANSNLYETYPEYSKYSKEIDYLNRVSDKIVIGDVVIFDYLTDLTTLFSGNAYNDIIKELTMLEVVLRYMGESGIGQLYTNKNFDFRYTTKDTFDFNKMKELINLGLNSKIYNNIPVVYTNNILSEFEEVISNDANKEEKINLQVNAEELKSQYKDVIVMLEFVVEYDLIDQVQKLYDPSFSELSDIASLILKVISEKGITGSLSLMSDIMYSPLIQKIHEYMGFKTLVETSLYTCLKLYVAMNNWLAEYRTTDLYEVADTFLRMKGVF